ncbi:glycogen synthase [bacterium]|nr:glycogen synthase [bacterium]
MAEKKQIKVFFIASEAAPFIKVGGLGDVAGSLPYAIARLPEAPELRMAIPLHKGIDQSKFDLEPVTSFKVKRKKASVLAEVFQTEVDGLTVYLIGGAPIAKADLVYTSDALADGEKFTFFSLAALELCKQLDWQPDILHAQDWHTAPAVYALNTTLKDDPFFANTATLLTVHNLPYLGNGAGPALKAYGLPPATKSDLPDWMQDTPLPLGLLTADKINTVSSGYANEMLTPEFGAGLEDFLKTRKNDLVGIVNGLDEAAWDPSTDPAIAANFSIDTLKDRQKNKLALLEEVGLDPDPEIPLLAFIGRMDYQKGIEIAIGALRLISKLPWQAVILGTGDVEIEAQARKMEEEFPQKVRTIIKYDGALARRIYAGADMMMVPSRYEPCGLIQMIAMRYASVPVARATGGLRDTITDYKEGDNSTGFLFRKASSPAMAKALRRALLVYPDKRRWAALQKHGMKQDFSWKQSAVKYLDIYNSLQKTKK